MNSCKICPKSIPPPTSEKVRPPATPHSPGSILALGGPHWNPCCNKLLPEKNKGFFKRWLSYKLDYKVCCVFIVDKCKDNGFGPVSFRSNGATFEWNTNSNPDPNRKLSHDTNRYPNRNSNLKFLSLTLNLHTKQSWVSMHHTQNAYTLGSRIEVPPTINFQEIFQPLLSY